ncbi:MAG: hypothetical protein ACOYL3_13605 [Desulfuromonadaceae bacterium]
MIGTIRMFSSEPFLLSRLMLVLECAVSICIFATTGTATADEVATFFIKAKPTAIAKLLKDLVELGLALKSGNPPHYAAGAA